MKRNKAIDMAIEIMRKHRRTYYAVDTSAAVYGFHFGEEAKTKSDQITDAINTLEAMKERQTKMNL